MMAKLTDIQRRTIAHRLESVAKGAQNGNQLGLLVEEVAKLLEAGSADRKRLLDAYRDEWKVELRKSVDNLRTVTKAHEDLVREIEADGR